ncbi:MAG: AbrB family transcriptional regulator [Beijerinckiaceae bacterium]
MPANSADIRATVETCLAGMAGLILFHMLRLPAPSLSGAMVGVACLLAVGRPVRLPQPAANAAMLLSGVAMGAAVTPEMLGGFQKYPLSILMFLACIAVTILLTQAFLMRAGGWDRLTSFLAATPGALSTVLVVGAEARADMLKLTTVQSFRLFMLVAVLPSLAIVAGSGSAAAPRPDASWPALAAMCAAGLVFAAAMARIGMAAPWIFGGLVGSAVLHGAGLVVGDAPWWFSEFAFGLVGLYIGTRFSSITKEALLDAFKMSVGALLIGLSVTFAFAYALHAMTGLPLGMVLVAFAPGGLEAMLVLGASLGLDPIYVGLHHLIRFFGIAMLLPVALPLIRRLERGNVPVEDKT